MDGKKIAENMFYAIFAELIILLINTISDGDISKKIFIFILGTIFAGILAFSSNGKQRVALIFGILVLGLLSFFVSGMKPYPIYQTNTPPIPDHPTAIPFITEVLPTLEIHSTSIPASVEILDRGAKMILIPAGVFIMGNNDADNTEKPEHSIFLNDFYMDQYEVTNGLYRACVDVGTCPPPLHNYSFTHPNYYNDSQFENYPVVYINWDMANRYCAWRGDVTGNKTHLPSEAEWEKAARGNDGGNYPWGNTLPDKGFLNYNRQIDDTTSVGLYLNGRSPYGLYDMAGNVWEWVYDWYDVYPGGDISASQDFGKTYHILRGGSWYTNDQNIGSTYRKRGRVEENVQPVDWYSGIGFRCAASP
jgi:formylglycine-generating enzyme required for sulfatase activity